MFLPRHGDENESRIEDGSGYGAGDGAGNRVEDEAWLELERRLG